MAYVGDLEINRQTLKKKQEKLGLALKEKSERSITNVPDELRHLPVGFFSNDQSLPNDYEGLSRNDKLFAVAAAMTKMSNSGWELGNEGQEKVSQLQKESLNLRTTIEEEADRQQRETLEKAVREKLKLRADAIGTTLESERDFMSFATYSSLRDRLRKLHESLYKQNLSPDDLQLVQKELTEIRDEIVKASDEGHSLFKKDKETLTNSIGLLHDKILKIKDLVSETQVKSWQDELEEIAQRVDSGNLNDVKEVVALGRRLNRLDEEMEKAYIDAKRKSSESFLTHARSRIELLPADFGERNEFIAAIDDLINRLRVAATMEELEQIREEFDALIEKSDSAYEQYLQRKEDEEFPKTLSLFIEAFKTSKGRKNILRNIKDKVLGKTDDDRRNRLKHLAVALSTSGATLAGLSIAHPDPWIVMGLTVVFDAAVAASAAAYPIVGSALEQ